MLMTHLIDTNVTQVCSRRVSELVAHTIQANAVIHKFLHLPFVVSLSNHERNQLRMLALRQACPEPVEGLRANGQCQRTNESLH